MENDSGEIKHQVKTLTSCHNLLQGGPGESGNHEILT